MSHLFRLDSYSYILPPEQIAQNPVVPAHNSKLLVVDAEGKKEDHIFHELPDIIEADRVMFFNNTEVIRSRIVLENALCIKKSGHERYFNGEIFFLEEIDSKCFKAMVYPGDYLPVGSTICVGEMSFLVREIIYEGRMLEIISGQSIGFMLEKYGQLPLPPYIEYKKEKEQGYQTIFASEKGSLAAPTASLHFTKEVLENLKKKGIEQHTITLHVGMGTFKDIHVDDIRDYVMHTERASIPLSLFETIATTKEGGKTILAVGTTVTRTLESLPYLWKHIREEVEYPKETQIFWNSKKCIREVDPLTNVYIDREKGVISFGSALFIYGEYPFQVVDEVITNFHLPESTLFILVSTYIGLENAHSIYIHAIDKKYRFFSFGDAMYLKKR